MTMAACVVVLGIVTIISGVIACTALESVSPHVFDHFDTPAPRNSKIGGILRTIEWIEVGWVETPTLQTSQTSLHSSCRRNDGIHAVAASADRLGFLLASSHCLSKIVSLIVKSPVSSAVVGQHVFA